MMPDFWFSYSTATDNMTGRVLFKKLLKDYRVVVVEKKNCPYCKLLRNVFTNYSFKSGATYHLDIEGRSDGKEIQDYMEELTRKRTVPQVYVKGSFIGGATDVEDLHKTGKLTDIFKKASAI